MTELEQRSFGVPFIDVDEWRDAPRRHRYIHGGFEGTHTRFSLYLPPAELYQGRMFQFLSGGQGGDEHSLPVGMFGAGAPVFDLCFENLGGYMVESNQGHFIDEGNTGVSGDVELFIASAETGIYSKVLAERMYGSEPHHSYVWGGSGGGLRSIACIENRPDVWDGAAPSLIGEGSGSPLPSALAYWWLYCRDKRAEIIDATEPGGSGDPFASLDHDERYALASLYRAGWNRGAESQLWNSGSWMFGLDGLKDNDPSFFDDFWNTPGYLGHDSPDRLAPIMVDQTYTVTKVHSGPGPGQMWLPGPAEMGLDVPPPEKGANYAIEVDGEIDDPNRMYMVRATILNGKAKGRQIYVAGEGVTLVGERMTGPEMFDGVESGDQVHLDNRELIAFAHRWMYAIDLERWTIQDRATSERTFASEYAGLGALMLDGRPIYPQRSGRMLPAWMTGALTRKVIHVACTHDTIVPVPSVGHYQRLVREHHGDRTDETYRLWWMENAPHGGPQLPAWTTPEKDLGAWTSRLVDVSGDVLPALVSWVEDGVPPPASTSYRFTSDSGLVLAPTAADRGGIQPIAVARANGGVCAEVKVGEPVTFTAIAEQPPGSGTIVFARWDFEGTGTTDYEHTLESDSAALKVEVAHLYDRPGTYFASFRVGGHAEGSNAKTPPCQNLARVRVVVNPM
jgi:hypothetical protein